MMSKECLTRARCARVRVCGATRHAGVTSGHSRRSEVVRDALTRLATERRKEEAVLRPLDEGAKSGRARPGVFNRIRSRILKKRR